MNNTNRTGPFIITGIYGGARCYMNRKGTFNPIDGSEVERAARFDSQEEAGKVVRRKVKAAPNYAEHFWKTVKTETLYFGVRG